LTCPVESKPNSRMIKTKTIVIVLMVPRSSTKDRRGQDAEQAAEQRT